MRLVESLRYRGFGEAKIASEERLRRGAHLIILNYPNVHGNLTTKHAQISSKWIQDLSDHIDRGIALVEFRRKGTGFTKRYRRARRHCVTNTSRAHISKAHSLSAHGA